ncbi:DUF4190 domain-containing protein [Granulicoccus sp. GXG6511]|uniref:DUF4190 domain-containing protein n=1 Tax=Granulicoccus sp. GXG6511 TaxID=3381351 RepID=UPI003D7E3375
MTGQHEPDPNNRFETWADGRTPAGQEPPFSASSGTEPPDWSPGAGDEPASGPSASDPPWQPERSADPLRQDPDFPTYPYASTYGDPQQDEAYSAFRGYQAGTGGYPGQSVQPYQPYQGPYATGANAFPRPAQNAPFAVPSLVLGIVSMFCGGVTGPIGLGLGIAALKQIEAQAGLGGRGMAIAGIITSALGTLVMLMWLMGLFFA